MHIDKALEQLSEIHAHLAKSQLYRGYRAVPSVLSGVLALVAAWVQPLLINTDPHRYVIYWSSVAVVAFCIAGGGIIWGFFRESDPHARGRTITVVGQLAPSLGVGAFVTIAILFAGNKSLLAYLPGLWALFYGLGWAASRPFLPKMIGWVTLFFLLSGFVLILRAIYLRLPGLSPWETGLPFGIGQILGGLVLYWNLERKALIPL